jgi:hypothetical protein
MKKPSKWMVLNKLDKKLGLKPVFIIKENVINVSRLTIGGRKGGTSVTYENKSGEIRGVTVIEEPSHIFNKISY